MEIIKKIESFIQENNLLNKEDNPIIVGFSGGADSMALLNILMELGYRCIAAHCNFHLREEESDRDFLFVKKYCSEHHIEFVSVDFDTTLYMQKQHLSLEMAARELRYQWFEELRIRFNTSKIAVAHHLDDSVETVLINLIRGTGIKGLTGIASKNGYVVRPLQCVYREEILAYLESHQTIYVTDSTNNENTYIRNKIRLDVIPLLEQINPSVKKSISITANNLLHTEKIYNDSIEKIKQKIFVNNRIDIKELLRSSDPQSVLFEILSPYGFNSETISDVLHSLSGQAGKQFIALPYYRLIKDRDFLILDKISDNSDEPLHFFISKEDTEITNPLKLRIERIHQSQSLEIIKSPKIAYINEDLLTYPLKLRHWKQGDKFVPFGMKGMKKISDYFSDHKFDLVSKEQVWLLCSAEDILWIVGERLDNRFRITEKTNNILKISIL